MAGIAKSSFGAKLTLLATNLLSVLPSTVTSILLDGTSYVPSDLQTSLQNGVALFTAVDSAQSLEKEAITARNAGEAALKAQYDQVVAYLRVILASNSSALAKVPLVAWSWALRTVQAGGMVGSVTVRVS